MFEPVDNLPTSGGHWRPAGWRSYALALSATAVAFAVTALLMPYLEEEVLYTPLVGTVVILSVACGPGPALVSTAVAWTAVLFLYVGPPPDFDSGGGAVNVVDRSLREDEVVVQAVVAQQLKRPDRGCRADQGCRC